MEKILKKNGFSIFRSWIEGEITFVEVCHCTKLRA